MIYFYRPREENLLIRSGVFQTLMRCTFRHQPSAHQTHVHSFFPYTLFIGKNCFFPAATVNIFSISAAPLFRSVPYIGVSAQFGRLQYIPDSPALFSFFGFAAQSAAPSSILSDNQNQRNILCKIRAASAVEDNGFVFCSLCRRDVEINGLPYSLFPASLLIYVKNPFPACEDRSCFRSCREWRGLHFRRTFQQAVRTTE